MINLELMRNVIRNPSIYGVTFAFIGAVGIFVYSVYDGSKLWKEKEDGDNFITIQLSAFAPPSKDKIAEEIRKPKHHKRHKQKKQETLEAPSKPQPSPLQAMQEPLKEEDVKQEQQETKEVEEIKEAETPTTIQSDPNALSDQNIKTMRYSEGIDNAFLRAIRTAIEKRHEYPNLARQRNYEGTVLLKFLINTQGQVSQIQVVRHSKYPILDKAAQKTIKRACRDFPKPVETTYIEIPIGYILAKN